jgi:hypothetical protein
LRAISKALVDRQDDSVSTAFPHSTVDAIAASRGKLDPEQTHIGTGQKGLV